MLFILVFNFFLHSTGVSNIVRSQDEDGRRMIEFDIQESFVSFGFYQSNNFTFPVTMKVVEEDPDVANSFRQGLRELNQVHVCM